MTKPTYEELVETLADLVAQQCQQPSGQLNSMASGTYAHAIRLLTSLGRVRIIHEAGRVVVAEWVKQ